MQLELLQPEDALADCQPRFVAYCRAHGYTSRDEQLDADRKKYPGGVMCGFICWIGAAWAAFGAPHQTRTFPEVSRAFDAWLPSFKA